MQKVLFLSLGNRDLQLPQNASIKVSIFNDHFVEGNEDTAGNYVLKKNNFNAHSQSVYDLYDTLVDHVTFPMVEQTLSEVGEEVEQIILLTTQQEPLDAQDCHFVALFLEKWLSRKGFSVTYRPIQFPPVDLERLMDFYNQLYDEFSDFQIYFGNSGGTPDMRAATHMAGMFRGVTFVTIQARTKVTSQKNFHNQEQRVLRHIIDNMLKVYDYEGVINLPVSKLVREKCKYALDLYNLKTDIVSDSDTFGEKSKKAVGLLLENMKICFQQGRYADVIGRIFRIEEALGQYLLYAELVQRGGVSNQDKVYRIDSKGNLKADKTFENALAKSESSESMYTQHFPEVFTLNEEKRAWYFFHYPNVPMKAGKNTFYFLFLSLGKFQELYEFLANLNDGYSQDNRLTKLRNKSYLGHGFKGVSKMDIEDITGDFAVFYNKLKVLLETLFVETIQPIFDQVNEDIRKL